MDAVDREPPPAPAEDTLTPGDHRLAAAGATLDPTEPASSPPAQAAIADPTAPDPTPPDATPPDPTAPESAGADPTAPEPAAESGAPDLVELALASVELSPEGLLPATGKVTLVDREGGGRLDIVMARPDAVLVQEAIAGTTPPRPRTHDLLIEAIAALSGAVTGVTLVERRPGGVYVANLCVLRPNGSVAELDARPSDALNVALRSRGAALRAHRSLVEVPAN